MACATRATKTLLGTHLSLSVKLWDLTGGLCCCVLNLLSVHQIALSCFHLERKGHFKSAALHLLAPSDIIFLTNSILYCRQNTRLYFYGTRWFECAGVLPLCFVAPFTVSFSLFDLLTSFNVSLAHPAGSTIKKKYVFCWSQNAKEECWVQQYVQYL